MHIKELIQLAVAADASDLHLTDGMPPILRIDGRLKPVEGLDVLGRKETQRLAYEMLSEEQIKRFESTLELDVSVQLFDSERVRINVHKQRGAVEAAFRIIQPKVRTLEELGLPPVAADLAKKTNGLVLVTGHAGVGKSTTLASMIELINTQRNAMIIIIEDPIEVVFTNKNSIIKQREVGTDTKSYANALRAALRQDPDVIMIGEMRDLETISTVLTAAETGHLVLSTLHTPDAKQTIDRIVDVFPVRGQEEIKIQLANSLQGIICQQLLPRSDAKGRVLATEILIMTPAVRNIIRSHKTEQLDSVMETGIEHGMRVMDRSLKELLSGKKITYQTAVSRIKNIDEFQRL